ncbi:putative lipase [Gordonia araii NBRC 100433]|uniref:Putative lipase n=1 Tax=Gordonia araii NBRC 100433 TaxID=1073574 RepID=G7H369_9ACTN|nr:lipase family protein [Gordonia araii]NNG96412.1 lipase [Gordonia araii NBRC 100433]GAB10294.1 putative lipase [Gordonia araii NBRC 100433]
MPTRLRQLVLVATALGALLSVAAMPMPGPAHADGPPPAADPFYRYAGELAAHRPGDILRLRGVAFVIDGATVPVTSTQVLYRSTGEHGEPIAGVTTVLRPGGAARRIVSFHMAYDALGSQCNPSYTLRGNHPSDAARVEQAVLAGYLARGFVVAVPDYEGLRQEWTIGRQSGQLALDGIRAALRVTRLPGSTPVGMLGYSGGSVPTEFGAELAPAYAPELSIVGAAAGGLPVNLAHNLGYVSGSRAWAGVIPALTEVYRRTYALDVGSFLSPRGKAAIAKVRHGCIAAFAANFPGLTSRAMVRRPYPGLLAVPSVRRAIARNVMGTVGRPRTPLLLAVGASDRIGDGVMVTADVAALARRYCAAGVSARFIRYAGDTHGKAFLPFERDAAAFLAARFRGEPVGGCST